MTTGSPDSYRALTAAAVLLVAAIAGTVSYLHIEALAVRYGQPLVAAVLLPLSVDGTVAVSGLAMLRSARAGLTAPWLARTMLLLAVGATLACNVGFGLPHGWPGALLSGWPAVAFVGCAEVAISMSRKRSPRGHDRTPLADSSPARKPPAKRTPKRSHGRTSGAASHAAVRAALSADPDITTGQLALMTGLSDRTVRRVKARMNGAAEDAA